MLISFCYLRLMEFLLIVCNELYLTICIKRLGVSIHSISEKIKLQNFYFVHPGLIRFVDILLKIEYYFDICLANQVINRTICHRRSV